MRLKTSVPISLGCLLAGLGVYFETAYFFIVVLHLKFIILQVLIDVLAAGIVKGLLILVEVALDLGKDALLFGWH